MGKDLTSRVRESTNAPATTEEKAPSLGQQIQQMQDQFRLAMPRGAEAAQLVRDALTCLRTTRKLAECEPHSVLGALMTCAQLGLRPGVLGHAWVLPFWDSRAEWLDEKGRKRAGRHRAQLIIGYQGLIELAHRSGQIKSLVARTVYENDEFEVSYGLDDTLVHKPVMRGSRGAPRAYYAVVKFTTGGHAFYLMTHDEMEEYRDRYAMARNKEKEVVGPWKDNFEGMALKTTIRQLSKWMPKSTEFASAIEADGTVRVDLTPDQPDAMLHGERLDQDTIDGELVDTDEPPADSGQRAETTEDSPDEPDPEPPGEPAPRATQMSKLHALLTKVGVGEDDRHSTAGHLVGRSITSMKELTRQEVSSVIDQLKRCEQSDDPARALDTVLANTGEQGGGNA